MLGFLKFIIYCVDQHNFVNGQEHKQPAVDIRFVCPMNQAGEQEYPAPRPDKDYFIMIKDYD